ncbi:MAG: polymer-forming cytoskeletal protein [Rhodospirillum sp.]|nr:polymer-forming cytoskeletal protein [Rhodospirillum sp.]MCF8487901.1 polymer-forming cytoskeletal protein [Rhodospirillum sp.]MCF8501453.1 polymer-forming cytoskeletal protein [Rhodospirillum sp.]
MFGRKTHNQPTPKETVGSAAPESAPDGAPLKEEGGSVSGKGSMEFTPKGPGAFTPARETPSFTPASSPSDGRVAPTFTPSPSVAAPPLKPFAQRGTQMPSRPIQTSYKQPDMPRRAMDIPGHGPRRADSGSAAAGDGKTLTVGREIQLSGEISACEHLVVEGKVQANLSNARVLEVSPGGEFHGKVTIEEADISGLFEGEMTVTRLLTIRPTGRVSGSVHYESMVVEDGGRIKGTVSPLSDDAVGDGPT